MAERSPQRSKLTIPSYDVANDIIFSILVKSSIKTLVRFTSVSKSWNDLIKSSFFVAAHHHDQIHNKSDDDTYSNSFYMPNDDRKAWRFLYIDPLSKNFELYDLLLPHRKYDSAGTCEGLICLTKDSDVYIWNPHVGSMKIVPPSRSSLKRQSTNTMKFVYGFGFAERSYDYRVVKLIFSKGSLVNMEIYSLVTDSWKEIDLKRWSHIRYWSKFYSKGYGRGSIYWEGVSKTTDRGAHTVDFRFNLDEEIFEQTSESPWSGYLETGDVRAQYKMCSSTPEFYGIQVRESLVLLDKKHNLTRIDMAVCLRKK